MGSNRSMYTAKASSAWKWPLWVPMVTGEVLILFALASAILRVLRIIQIRGKLVLVGTFG